MSRRKKPKKVKLKRRRQPKKPAVIKYGKEHLLLVNKWFRRNSSWQMFLWCQRWRMRWRWWFILVFVIALLLWWFGVDHMKHFSIAMCVEHLLHHLTCRAAGFVEEEMA